MVPGIPQHVGYRAPTVGAPPERHSPQSGRAPKDGTGREPYQTHDNRHTGTTACARGCTRKLIETEFEIAKTRLLHWGRSRSGFNVRNDATETALLCLRGSRLPHRGRSRTGQVQCGSPMGGAHMDAKLQRAGASTTTWRQLLLWTGLRRALVVLRVLRPGSYRLPRRLVVLSQLGPWRG